MPKSLGQEVLFTILMVFVMVYAIIEVIEVTEQHNELSALIGLDWMPNGWTLTAQYYCDYLFGNIEQLE